jgi:oxaloacetate decarboxylase gamma subunit
MDSMIITQGFDLMLYGMGTVFTFLTLLVGVTLVMSWLVNSLVPEDMELISASVQVPLASETIEPRIVKAIQAALNQHRS